MASGAALWSEPVLRSGTKFLTGDPTGERSQCVCCRTETMEAMSWAEQIGIPLRMTVCNQCHRNGDFADFLSWWMTRRVEAELARIQHKPPPREKLFDCQCNMRLLEWHVAAGPCTVYLGPPVLPYRREAEMIMIAYLRKKTADAKKAA